jgi:E3 ubiquitin-protein ligase MYCBP2
VLQLWLALASLCVLDNEHGERLSSGQWVNGQANQQRVSKLYGIIKADILDYTLRKFSGDIF